MESKIVPIATVKPNATNPRTIKDYKFRKLVKSIKEFPQMLEYRPIVVNEDMVVLGGNMRLRACQEAGLKEVPIILASDLSIEQQDEFIIKDNASFGEWDWDVLANIWDTEKLSEWGLDVVTMEDVFDEAGIDDDTEIFDDNEVVVTMRMPRYEYKKVSEEIDNFLDRNKNIVCKVQN